MKITKNGAYIYLPTCGASVGTCYQYVSIGIWTGYPLSKCCILPHVKLKTRVCRIQGTGEQSSDLKHLQRLSYKMRSYIFFFTTLSGNSKKDVWLVGIY